MKLPPKRIWLPLLAVLLIAGGGLGWYLKSSAMSPEQRYKTQAIARTDIAQSVSANGTLNPVVLVNVGTQVSGTVRRLYVDFNNRVEQDQKLLELDDTLLAAQAGASAANVANALAALELARANAQRAQALFGQEYISRQEYDQATQAEKSARAQLDQARAQAARDRANLSYTTIRSPVSGVVVDRQVDVGQTVAASFQTPTLFKIAKDLTKMQIDSNFAEADIGQIRVGQPVRFNVDAFPDRAFRGSVRQIRLNPTTQQNVVTYDVVVEVDNPDEILLPGMTAYVSIVVAQRKDVLTVPNAALRFKPSEPPAAKPGEAQRRKREAGSGMVHVLEGGKLRPVSVALGITDNRNTEVIGGDLKPGDLVVVAENQATPEADGRPNAMRMRMF